MVLIVAEGKLARELKGRIPSYISTRILSPQRALKVRQGNVSLAIVTRPCGHTVSWRLRKVLHAPIIFVPGGSAVILKQVTDRSKACAYGPH